MSGRQNEGLRFANRCTEVRAASQSEVKYEGGPCNSGCCARAASKKDSGLVVQNASPTSKVRSDGRKNETWPGVWPGVCSTFPFRKFRQVLELCKTGEGSSVFTFR
jgi:hypothetical protein